MNKGYLCRPGIGLQPIAIGHGIVVSANTAIGKVASLQIPLFHLSCRKETLYILMGCSSLAASGAKRRKQPPFLNCDITLSLSIDVDALIVKVKGVKIWLRTEVVPKV